MTELCSRHIQIFVKNDFSYTTLTQESDPDPLLYGQCVSLPSVQSLVNSDWSRSATKK